MPKTNGTLHIGCQGSFKEPCGGTETKQTVGKSAALGLVYFDRDDHDWSRA